MHLVNKFPKASSLSGVDEEDFHPGKGSAGESALAIDHMHHMHLYHL